MEVRRRVAGLRVVLAMALTGVLALAGCSTSDSSTGGTNVTATPTFNPGAGSYNTAQTVTVADTTPGAVLYCTTDGSTPTTSSPQCSQPTTIYQTSFLQAIAVAPNKSASAVASAGYTINLNAAATPTFSPDGGSYTGTQQVTINDATAGANIRYTLDGSTPGPNSTLYTPGTPVSITKSSTLSAIAIASGFANSGIRSAAYTIGNGPAAPVISPAGGSFTAATTVALTDATPGATIYYTTDNSTPTSASTLYSGSFTVSTSQTISAIAISSGITSTVTKAVFTINLPAAATPTFNPAGATYQTAQQVVLSDATAGATIYYTVDGSTPTTASTLYNGTSVNVAQSETIKAIAVAAGFSNSAVASAAYIISSSVPQPTFSPAGGSFGAATPVTLNDTDASAVIYYTIDGSNPSASSTRYTAPINVASTETINAIAIDGSNSSAVATATYTISAGTSFSGKVKSGTSAVSGATVQMYAAGSGGYASSAGLVSTAPVTTAADGSFALSYSCPSATAFNAPGSTSGDLVYILATGGQVGSGGANASLVFMAALGSCNAALPSSLVVNEATTVASAYALSQFMSGPTNVGSSSGNYAAGVNTAPGLTNAFATVGNLVDLTTGQVRDRTPAYANNLANDLNVLNNSTVPQTRINTLANALNACAASSSACSGLFSAATPQSGTAPSNTLQAILNIAQNPGNNVGAVFTAASGGTFTPVLSAAPNDWTLALTFTGGGLGFAPDIQITSKSNSTYTAGKMLATAMAIDATGNVYVTGYTVDRTSSATTIKPDAFSGMVAKFDNLGHALTQPSVVNGDGSVTYGGSILVNQTNGCNSSVNNAGTQAPHSMAIAPLDGSLWILGGTAVPGDTGCGGTNSTGGALTKLNADLSVNVPFISLGSTIYAGAVVIDSGGNVWVHDNATSKVGLASFNSDGSFGFFDKGTYSGYTVGYGPMQAMAFDSLGTSLWDSDALSATQAGLEQINPTNASDVKAYYPTFASSATTAGSATPLVAGPTAPDGTAGNVYGCTARGGQSLDVLNVSSTSILNTYPISTGRGCGSQMVMDGNNHLFVITGSTTSTITPGIIDEFAVTSSGISLLSPSTGFTGTSTGEIPTINLDPNSPVRYTATQYLVPSHGVPGAAIDGSGNLWVLNVDTGTDASEGNILVEFVGLAAPVVTPTSRALNFGEVGVRP